MGRLQEVAAWRQAAAEMNVARPSGEVGRMAVAGWELASVLVLVEVGTVLLASAWDLAEVAMVLLELGSASALALVEVAEEKSPGG